MTPGEKKPSTPIDPEVRESLGRLTPQAAWEQIKTLVQRALEYQPTLCQRVNERLNLPMDSTDLTATLEFMDPVDGVKHFQYINDLPLDNLMKQEPIKVYEGVVRIFTLSDRYAALW